MDEVKNIIPIKVELKLPVKIKDTLPEIILILVVPTEITPEKPVEINPEELIIDNDILVITDIHDNTIEWIINKAGIVKNIIPVKVELKLTILIENSLPEIILILVVPTEITPEKPVIDNDILVITDMLDNTIEWIINKAGIIEDYDEFLSIIREVLIRFNTEPKRYSKEDYLKLIQAVVACFKHLYSQDIFTWAVTEWSDILSDDKIPTEKLVKKTIDLLDNRLSWIRYCDPEDTEDENEL